MCNVRQRRLRSFRGTLGSTSNGGGTADGRVASNNTTRGLDTFIQAASYGLVVTTREAGHAPPRPHFTRMLVRITRRTTAPRDARAERNRQGNLKGRPGGPWPSLASSFPPRARWLAEARHSAALGAGARTFNRVEYRGTHSCIASLFVSPTSGCPLRGF